MRQYNIPASTHAAILRTEAEVMRKCASCSIMNKWKRRIVLSMLPLKSS